MTDFYDKAQAAAVELCKERGGLVNLDREELCERLGVAPGSFTHFAGMTYSSFVDELRGETGVEIGVTRNGKRQRLSSKMRREQLVTVALKLAEIGNYQRVTRHAIAEAAGVAATSVSNYFGTQPQISRAIMRAAVTQGVIAIIAQGLEADDPQAHKAPAPLKAAARKI